MSRKNSLPSSGANADTTRKSKFYSFRKLASNLADSEKIYANNSVVCNTGAGISQPNFPAYGVYRYGGALPLDRKRLTCHKTLESSHVWKYHYSSKANPIPVFRVLIEDKLLKVRK
jgi:hypothetical protein